LVSTRTWSKHMKRCTNLQIWEYSNLVGRVSRTALVRGNIFHNTKTIATLVLCSAYKTTTGCINCILAMENNSKVCLFPTHKSDWYHYREECKIIVFLSSQDSVEFHYSLLTGVTMHPPSLESDTKVQNFVPYPMCCLCCSSELLYLMMMARLISKIANQKLKTQAVCSLTKLFSSNAYCNRTFTTNSSVSVTWWNETRGSYWTVLCICANTNWCIVMYRCRCSWLRLACCSMDRSIWYTWCCHRIYPQGIGFCNIGCVMFE